MREFIRQSSHLESPLGHRDPSTPTKVADSIIEEDKEIRRKWTAIEKLPTFKRLRTSLLDIGEETQKKEDEEKCDGKKVVDVTKLEADEKHLFIEKLIKHIEHDNLRLLRKLRERIDRVNVKLPTVEVRYKNLCVEAKCEVVSGKPLPTLWNSLATMISAFTKKALLCKSQEAQISILTDVSGVIKSSRLTLLLGPPGCGKTTFLLALAGKLDKSLKVTGEISYNGHNLEEFVPQKTSAYISQYDQHIPEMTVRETIDFSGRCQGVGARAEMITEVSRREKELGIVPDPDIDTYMKAISIEGQETNLQTDYILKILGLDICSDVMVGDALQRGISGGQKKRLTTGEMIVGPTKALFMDEISTGLDSSTTFQIIACLQHFVHITDATILVSLLQPAPETFDLFDDLILMAEGKILYHGPHSEVLGFFQDCGFKCPERKGSADFLQEVISNKDQAQYWSWIDRPYSYVSVDQFSRMFKESDKGTILNNNLSKPYDKSQSHNNSLSFNIYSVKKWELLKACTAKEFLLIRRNSFLYIFKTLQLVITAFITMTVFIRTEMSVDLASANYLMGSLYYALVRLATNGMAEMALTIIRLPVVEKQLSFHLYPAWAYSMPASILKIPFSIIDSLLWTALTYYVIGYSPEIQRFLCHFLALLALHMASTSMCRLIASVFRTMISATTFGFGILILMFTLGGFILPRDALPSWLRWGFWLSFMTYGEISLSLNEFLAPRWQKASIGNSTVGKEVLSSHDLDFDGYFYWISIGALFCFTVLFDLGFVLALTYLKPTKASRAMISKKKLSQLQSRGNSTATDDEADSKSACSIVKRQQENLVLQFEPLTISFENVQYYVDTPAEMKVHGFDQKRLQLLRDVTGAFRPGVLTALMGVSGAGKTTLMDVLSGRKTGGVIEGDIRISGYQKVQKTFARISGYCEQNDIHSSQVTVEESIAYSAWLRLSPEIDVKTKSRFVEEVIETIELGEIKDHIVGIPGESGLSTEQRKRLTIAVELVSNPSIIFMDEPTSGLDARAAAIVMRAVKNVVSTGRTTVCTIHQPSIDIFEAFDELILMKRGGLIIYSGIIGHQSRKLIQYFEGIHGVPKIKDKTNPATWMLEVSSASVEAEHGIDFAAIYKESSLYRDTVDLVKQLSSPKPGSMELQFPTRFPQSSWVQFKACLWRQNMSYWRSPEYNSVRFVFMVAASVLFAAIFWQKGKDINDQQDLFNILGSMYIAVIFLGINNCSGILPYVAAERSVLFRERFAGMYSSIAYSFAQVTIEIPYILAQTIAYVLITYPTIGYEFSIYKVLWYFYTAFCTFLYFVYLGMFLVALTPNLEIASVLASAIYTILNIFSGFLMPGPRIPKWWVWCYWICPTSWSLHGLLASQYGDNVKEIMIFGERKTVASFLEDFYGFRHSQLSLVAVMLFVFPLAYASLFAYCIRKLNYQKR